MSKQRGPFYITTLNDNSYDSFYGVRIQGEKVESWETPTIIGLSSHEHEAQEMCDTLNQLVLEWLVEHGVAQITLKVGSEL